MNVQTTEAEEAQAIVDAKQSRIPNGSGAAAILSAGLGCFAVALLAFIADKSAAIKSMMIVYKPTGPLSGVTTLAIAVWLVCWLVLELRWRQREVAMKKISLIGVGLLLLSVLLTFPPIVDLL
ncbi:MAG TPA: hypothetical protein VK720_03745 [Terracidiphilus sp.]|jgi:hypothetical protein|nr:hypothetical protein [Terracidiphilus sp.]